MIHIQQDGMYNDYVKRFVSYLAPLSHMVESVLRDAFVIGLKPALQAEVVIRHPQTLEECMKEAQLVIDRNLALKLAREELGLMETKSGESSGNKNKGGNEKRDSKGIRIPMKQVTILNKGSYQKNEPPIKRLSDAEFRARLDKGLCFRCNEKYSHGHRCFLGKKELMLFILNEEESTGEEGTSEEKIEGMVELKQLDIAEGSKVELETVMGFSSKGTMKRKRALWTRKWWC